MFVIFHVESLSPSTLNFQYRSTDYVVPGPGKLQLVYTPKDGSKPVSLDVYDFKAPGVAMSMYNTDEVRHCSFTGP